MIKQLLDEVEQNIVICQWRADQLFAEAEAQPRPIIANYLHDHNKVLQYCI